MIDTGRPMAPPATLNEWQKSSGTKNKKVMGTKFTFFVSRENMRIKRWNSQMNVLMFMSKTRLKLLILIPKLFRGDTPEPPLKGRGGWKERKREMRRGMLRRSCRGWNGCSWLSVTPLSPIGSEFLSKSRLFSCKRHIAYRSLCAFAINEDVDW